MGGGGAGGSARVGAVAARALSYSRRSFKVLCVDCDNTLWRGVVGEDGPEALAAQVGEVLRGGLIDHAAPRARGGWLPPPSGGLGPPGGGGRA